MSGRPAVYMATNTVNGKKYIGATAIGFDARKRRHLDRAGRDRACPRFYDAIKKYGADVFEWKILKEFDSPQCAFSFERVAISLIKPEYNVTSGGFGTPDIKAWNRRKVICLEDGTVFDSMDAAGKAYGASSGDICSACKGRQKTVKNRHFILYELPLSPIEREEMIRKMDANAAKMRRRRDLFGLKKRWSVLDGDRDALGRSAAGPKKNSRPVICIDTSEMFPSASAAAEYFDVEKSAIVEMCLGKRGRKSVGGFRFSYLEAG